jgi:NAD(P)H dehydrogenase (quinone)
MPEKERPTRTLGSTGSPLPPETYRWAYRHVKEDMLLAAISGGTDPGAAFLTSCPILPVHAGEMQCRGLGVALHALDDSGRELMDEVGELVVTEPMPSMPLYFWGDEDGKRYHESYFQTYPGLWRHGDWLRLIPRPESVTGIIYGRSDSTINRHGLRMGTSEIYRVVEEFPEVLESLVIDLEYLGRPSCLTLFIVLRDGDAAVPLNLRSQLFEAIRAKLSPRYVPDDVFAIREVPRTLSGKKMEVPVKRFSSGSRPIGWPTVTPWRTLPRSTRSSLLPASSTRGSGNAPVSPSAQRGHGEVIGGVMSKLSVIYYSATGHGTAMARRVADAAEGAGAEVRVRHVAETRDPESFAQNPAWTANYEATKDLPAATGDDIVWADAVIFGSPTRFGSPSSQFRTFIDSLGGLWTQGKLADKVYAGFTSSQTAHGGQETTLLALYITLMHFGGIIVPPGYTEGLKFVDGNPYGVSHITGPENMFEINDATAAALDHLARRVVSIADRLVGSAPENA